jgi:ATP-dependent metalloprotease
LTRPKKKAPIIVVIDEIDALSGSRKLKDQSALKMTLNELLVKLDGFEDNTGIIVIGATNFADSLDPALLRPGRFDKHVSVPLSDLGGRKEKFWKCMPSKQNWQRRCGLGHVGTWYHRHVRRGFFNLMNRAVTVKRPGCCLFHDLDENG